MILKVDRKVYSDSCISKSVYALANKYSIERRVEGDNEELIVQPISAGCADDDLVKRDVINALNDFKLRCIIEEETKDIRTIIYAKAFADYTEGHQ
jgi:His-Xaa-Ser system protein HxsD